MQIANQGRGAQCAARLALALVALAGCAEGPAQRSPEPRAVELSQAVTAKFPLAVSAGGRYLVDQSGSPFRLQTDAAWVTVAHADDATVSSYLNGIKSAGFTSFILMNIVHAGGPGWPNLNEPADFYGNQPFLTKDALDTPNPAYFSRVSGAIDQALSLGLAVQFFHTYAGGDGGNDGWESVISNSHNTDAICFKWGVYLANTFRQPNIIWMHGGDHDLSGVALSRFQNIVAGIESVSRNRLSGSEWKGPDSIATDQVGFTYGTDPARSDMQINSFYGAGPASNGQTFLTADRSWRNQPTLPAVLQEPAYEDAWYAPAIAGRQQVRATYHWAVTAGAIAGGTVGAKHRWDWQVGHNPLGTLSTSPVTLDAVKAFAFYQTIPWYLMLPSGTQAGQAGRDLVVSGGGSGNSTITSSITSDGTVLIAYVPPTGSSPTNFAVDLRSMSGASRGRWWNPTNGTYLNITAGNYSLSNRVSSQSFTTPGDNGTQFNDWMLILDATGTTGSDGGTPPAGGAGGSSAGGASGSAGGASGNSSAGSGGSGGTGASSGSSPITIGEPAVLPSDDSGNGGVLVAQKATLSVAGTLTSMSFYAGTATGKLRLGLYDAAGSNGSPGNKLAETAEISPRVGWNTANILTPVDCAPGNYWLAYETNSNGLHFRTTNSGTAQYYSRAYGILPTTFSSSASSGNFHWSFYASLVPPNAAPTVTTPASATPSQVAGTTTRLSALGADDGGEGALTYLWATTGTPPAAVSFAPNGSNAAKTTTATFAKAGSYSFLVTISDAQGKTVSSSTTASVAQTLSSIAVTPLNASVIARETLAFRATASDQFGLALATQPTFAWSVNGGGTISGSGVFTAGATAGGPFTVVATSGSRSGSGSVTVTTGANLTIGEAAVLSTVDSGNANVLVAQQAMLPKNATIQTLSFYARTAGSRLRLGLYDSTGTSGGPGAKLAEAPEITTIAGWNTVNVTSQVLLQAGTYWLAYLTDNNGLEFVRTGTSSGLSKYYSINYGPLPATFSTSPTTFNDHWSFYATLAP